jgi:hypothetical protein
MTFTKGTTMTKEQMAAQLSGREYREEITDAEHHQARQSGLPVVFGRSDDLVEFRGVCLDEVGAYGGATIDMGARGNPIEYEDDHRRLIEAGWTPPPDKVKAFEIKAGWCPKGFDGSWRISASIPFAAFNVNEDGRFFCRGVVVDVKDAAIAQIKGGA